MEMPCPCYLVRYVFVEALDNFKVTYKTIKSIFNAEGQEAYPFLNYWNLDQTFLIEGTTSQGAI